MNFVGGLKGLRARGIRWSRQHIGRLEHRVSFRNVFV
jgi:hypothetical protein